MRIALAAAAWAASVLPVIAGASAKVVAAVWGGLLVGAVLYGVRDRARAMVLIFLGTLCFPAVDYLMPPPPGFVGGAPGSLAYFPADVFLAAAAVLAAAGGAPRVAAGPLRPLLVAGAVCAAAHTGGALVSDRPLESWMQWAVLVRGMGVAVVILALGGYRRAMVTALLVGPIMQGALAAAQHLRGKALGLAFLGEAPADQLFKYISPGVGLWRSGGTLGHPNVLATYAVAMLPVALTVGSARGEGVRRVLALAAAVGAAAALLWTYSRAAWAIGALTVAFVAVGGGLHRRFRSRKAWIAAGLTVLVAATASPAIVFRLQRTESSATDVRRDLVSVARAMTRAYPLSGVGLAQFPARVAEFDPELRLLMFRHPAHNIVVLDAAETGVLGGAASVALWGLGLGTAGVWAWRAARRRALESMGLWVGCAAIILHNGVDWTLRQPVIMALFWTLAALGSSAAAETPRRGGFVEGHPTP